MYLRFDLSVLHSNFLFSKICFSGRKSMFKKKNSLSKVSYCLPAYIYTCRFCTHIRIHMCQGLVHLDSSGTPGVSFRPLGSHPSTLHACVCVCAYAHTYTHMHSRPRQKNTENADKPSNFFHVNNSVTCQQQVPNDEGVPNAITTLFLQE